MLKTSTIIFLFFEQVTEASRFLDKYDTYMKNSNDCSSCQEVWRTMKQNREIELKLLMGAIIECINSDNTQPEEKVA